MECEAGDGGWRRKEAEMPVETRVLPREVLADQIK